MKFLKNSGLGFSLIEILCVIAIIGILAGMAYPSYQKHMLATHRANAKVVLTDLAAKLEHYHLKYHTYIGATLNKFHSYHLTPNNKYAIKIEHLSSDNFIISATPIESQQADHTCGSLALDARGNKHISGKGHLQACW